MFPSSVYGSVRTTHQSVLGMRCFSPWCRPACSRSFHGRNLSIEACAHVGNVQHELLISNGLLLHFHQLIFQGSDQLRHTAKAMQDRRAGYARDSNSGLILNKYRALPLPFCDTCGASTALCAYCCCKKLTLTIYRTSRTFVGKTVEICFDLTTREETGAASVDSGVGTPILSLSWQAA